MRCTTVVDNVYTHVGSFVRSLLNIYFRLMDSGDFVKRMTVVTMTENDAAAWTFASEHVKHVGDYSTNDEVCAVV